LSVAFAHWRLIPDVFPIFLEIGEALFPDGAASLSFLLQKRENFSNSMSVIFALFVEFLTRLQNYCIQLQINGTRELRRERLDVLATHQDFCVNFCILTSTSFNNIESQIGEEDFPLSSRQSLVQFLTHWCEVPDQFEKLSIYAKNALGSILRLGTVFAGSYEFHAAFLELMLKCELAGYDVLQALLKFHVDILMSEYVTHALLRNRRESTLFIDAIMAVLTVADDRDELKSHVGALLLFARTLAIEQMKKILIILAIIFLDPSLGGPQHIETAEDLDYLPTLFKFATEQVIAFALSVLSSSPMLSVTSAMIKFVRPWFTQIRLLPTNPVLINGIPRDYQKFSAITFVRTMVSVSASPNEEQLDLFSQLWYELLQSSDSAEVLLVILFAHNSSDVKEKTFMHFLQLKPILIAKFLARRCSFAYWYFRNTVTFNDPLSWIIRVLSQAVYFLDVADHRLIRAFHYSLLFLEDTAELFDTIIYQWNVEFDEPACVWLPGTNRAASIVADCMRDRDG
jgi:hypothetical protein